MPAILNLGVIPECEVSGSLGRVKLTHLRKREEVDELVPDEIRIAPGILRAQNTFHFRAIVQRFPAHGMKTALWEKTTRILRQPTRRQSDGDDAGAGLPIYAPSR